MIFWGLFRRFLRRLHIASGKDVCQGVLKGCRLGLRASLLLFLGFWNFFLRPRGHVPQDGLEVVR